MCVCESLNRKRQQQQRDDFRATLLFAFCSTCVTTVYCLLYNTSIACCTHSRQSVNAIYYCLGSMHTITRRMYTKWHETNWIICNWKDTRSEWTSDRMKDKWRLQINDGSMGGCVCVLVRTILGSVTLDKVPFDGQSHRTSYNRQWWGGGGGVDQAVEIDFTNRNK